MLKIVTLFLIFMAVLAMFGRLRLPKITRRQGGCRNRGCASPAGATTCAAGRARIAPKGRAEAAAEFALAGLGLVILLLAGDVLVKGAVNLSLRLGIPALIVSLTIVAFGTSAPELLISDQVDPRRCAGAGAGQCRGVEHGECPAGSRRSRRSSPACTPQAIRAGPMS
jgi:hypothetical protein